MPNSVQTYPLPSNQPSDPYAEDWRPLAPPITDASAKRAQDSASDQHVKAAATQAPPIPTRPNASTGPQAPTQGETVARPTVPARLQVPPATAMSVRAIGLAGELQNNQNWYAKHFPARLSGVIGAVATGGMLFAGAGVAAVPLALIGLMIGVGARIITNPSLRDLNPEQRKTYDAVQAMRHDIEQQAQSGRPLTSEEEQFLDDAKRLQKRAEPTALQTLKSLGKDFALGYAATGAAIFAVVAAVVCCAVCLNGGGGGGGVGGIANVTGSRNNVTGGPSSTFLFLYPPGLPINIPSSIRETTDMTDAERARELQAELEMQRLPAGPNVRAYAAR